MKVAVYYNNRDIRIEERPVPSVKEGELLIKIHSASICGSDVTEWYRVEKVGRVLGHEIAGEVAEVGAGVAAYKKGDRVVASHHVPCYQCHYCRLGHHTLCSTLKTTNFDPGGFAQLIRLPAINVRHGVYRLPDHVSYEEGTFTEPLACAIRGQRKADVRKGQTVLIIGSGISGLLHLLLARANGIDRISAVDIDESRLKAAGDFGADQVWHASEDIGKRLLEWNENRLADCVIVCSGAETSIRQALDCVGLGGTVLFFALIGPDCVFPMPMNRIFWQKGATLMNSYAASPEDHHESLELIGSGRIPVRKMITHRLPLGRIGEGFQLAAEAKKSLKVIIDPNN
ncbi:MAG: alcohol dehydrogenase catalytic domain-containing protein [Deltaproteobacteria bacterium]|nr:alcohol dehydrogenase catalytic domain-containing protein [Deltaproteobacteria bacterium]